MVNKLEIKATSHSSVVAFSKSKFHELHESNIKNQFPLAENEENV